MSEENQQLYYYHGDHLGSAQIVTDPEGEIYEQLEYTPYGELWVEHVPVVETTPFRFTRKERDSETGLYYFGARYLNPQTSMWLSADPAMGEYIPQAPINDEAKQHNKELPGMGGVFNYVNLHAYHYAGNNPVKLTDPDGNFAIAPLVLAILKAGAIGAGVSVAIDSAKQAVSSYANTGKVNIDAKQTVAAGVGGFVGGAVTGGTGMVASQLPGIGAKGAVILGNAVAGGAGSVTNTVIDNSLHQRPVTDNLSENFKTGIKAGMVTGILTPVSASNSVASQGAGREMAGELINGARDEMINFGVSTLSSQPQASRAATSPTPQIGPGPVTTRSQQNAIRREPINPYSNMPGGSTYLLNH